MPASNSKAEYVLTSEIFIFFLSAVHEIWKSIKKLFFANSYILPSHMYITGSFYAGLLFTIEI